jgi:hypothetical protein
MRTNNLPAPLLPMKQPVSQPKQAFVISSFSPQQPPGLQRSAAAILPTGAPESFSRAWSSPASCVRVPDTFTVRGCPAITDGLDGELARLQDQGTGEIPPCNAVRQPTQAVTEHDPLLRRQAQTNQDGLTSRLRRFEHRVHVPLEEVGVRLVTSLVWEGDDLAFIRVESLAVAELGAQPIADP